MRVLLIEDEPKLAGAIRESLGALDYETQWAANGEEGYYLATTTPVDLIILDLNLPCRDGIDILSGLRSTGCRRPVLILSARDGLEDRVKGLDAGADDYLLKPFEFAELHARLRALSRRGRGDEVMSLRCADLVLDRLTRKVERAGQAIDLTAKEFDMLLYLLIHQGHVVTRKMMALEVWGQRARVVPLDNVIDVHMARLRAKVDTPFGHALIKTRRGLGYVLQDRD